MRKKPKLNVNKDEFIEKYKDHNQYEMAAHFGISLSSVHKLRILYGIPMKRQLFHTLDVNEFKRL